MILHDILLHGTTSMELKDYLRSLSKVELMDVIDKPDRRGRSPLAWAVENCWVMAVETLLNVGADVNQRQYGVNGESTPLIHLAIAGEASIEDILGVIKLMFRYGADVNGVDDDLWTPLHIAASWHQPEAIKLLAEEVNLDWNAKAKDKKNALDLVIDANEQPNPDDFPHVEAFLMPRIASSPQE
jgi:ankyrin repeat protein